MCIIYFIDPEHRSQAVVKYHSVRVDRPVSRLVRVVKADKEISKKGKSVCPYAIAVEEIQAGRNEEEEENLPAPEENDMAASHQDDYQQEELQGTPQLNVQGKEDDGQDVRRHLPGVQPPPLPLPPPTDLLLGQGQGEEEPQQEEQQEQDKEKPADQDAILTVGDDP